MSALQVAETNRVPFDLTDQISILFNTLVCHLIYLKSICGIILFLGGCMMTSVPWSNHANIFILSPIVGLLKYYIFIYIR